MKPRSSTSREYLKVASLRIFSKTNQNLFEGGHGHVHWAYRPLNCRQFGEENIVLNCCFNSTIRTVMFAWGRI